MRALLRSVARVLREVAYGIDAANAVRHGVEPSRRGEDASQREATAPPGREALGGEDAVPEREALRERDALRELAEWVESVHGVRTEDEVASARAQWAALAAGRERRRCGAAETGGTPDAGGAPGSGVPGGGTADGGGMPDAGGPAAQSR
ncbi:hypothetical protein V1J52_07320 [Streptomyces sp. TRM 70351]|uniref:hypothetical protein n=1 Tax=Streptomyces sp. TRM 70351 TaxID=3116552 RepID=UPI002E7BB006|nr:hypothetical protein [Streptomyces sp. TRM 70351]MEE1928006.1 hypothetical protein [Streptomyces sp. TRM 70351]